MRRRYYAKPRHKHQPIPSKLMAGLIGYPLTLTWMLIENASAFAEKPGTMLIGLLFSGWLVSAFAYILIGGWRGELHKQTLREDWHDIVGKPKKGD